MSELIENMPGTAIGTKGAALRAVSHAIDRAVVGFENETKGRRVQLSEKMDLSEYNKPEFFEKPELFYDRGLEMPDMKLEPLHTRFGVRVTRFSFRSEITSGDENNDRVMGRMFDAREKHGGRSAPCVIAINGWREPGAFSGYYYILGLLLAWIGINVVFTSQPYHGPRRPHGSVDGELMLSGNMERTVLAFRQSVCDMRSLVTWTRAEYTGGVGIMGFSLGGFVTLLTACVEDRIDFAIPLIAAGDLIEGMWEGIAGRTIIRDFNASGVTPEMAAANWRIVSPINFRPKISLDRIHIIAGRFDLLIPEDNVHNLWERWGHPGITWLLCGHISIFLFARKMVRTIVSHARKYAA